VGWWIPELFRHRSGGRAVLYLSSYTASGYSYCIRVFLNKVVGLGVLSPVYLRDIYFFISIIRGQEVDGCVGIPDDLVMARKRQLDLFPTSFDLFPTVNYVT